MNRKKHGFVTKPCFFAGGDNKTRTCDPLRVKPIRNKNKNI